jgi:aminopeptidase N
MQMLRRRLGDKAFLAMLAELLKRYERSTITTEQFRLLAAQYLPPKSDDPKLEQFFDQWVYGTGVPALKLTYALKGKAPNYRLAGTLTQSDAGEDCSVLAPVEIRTAPGRSITEWVRTGNEPATFSVPLKQPPLKVVLDPNHAVLRK